MKPGISQITMPEYLAIKALSSGICHTIIAESPLHAKYQQDNPRESSEVSDIGTAFHDAFLEGVDRILVVDAKDWRTNVAKEQRDLARAAGRIPMLTGKVQPLYDMIDSAKRFLAQSELHALMIDGEPELTLQWDEQGIACKARPDWMKSDYSICLSVKTTAGSANPETWIRTQLPGYNLASAFYEAGIRAACKVEQTRVIHFVVEQTAPYSCSLIALDPAWQALAEAKLATALAVWAECVKANRWPAFPAQICYASPRPWQLAEAQERELQDAEENGIEYDPSKIWEKPE